MTVQNIVLLKFAKFIQRSIKNIPTVFLKWDIIWSANLETREAHIHPNHIQVTTPPPVFTSSLQLSDRLVHLESVFSFERLKK